jgi:hypothetical protein
MAKDRATNGYALGLGITVFGYVLLYSAFLWHCDGHPYVCDNNETYSALWHAHNLYHFPFSHTHGVTDEACSPHAEAHPFFYTHEGNFPRLYAFLLYALGVRSAQSQIVITTLTIGLCTIVLGFHFFYRRVNAGFAAIAMLFLMTDYVLFMQWQVVTFRCWHFFFFFACLLCVDGAAAARWWWKILTVLTFMGLYYYEPVFVLFQTVTCVAYAGFRYFRQWRVLTRFVLTAGSGAALCIAIFLGQLLLTFGPAIVWDDIRFTILAREHGGGSPDQAARIMAEFAERRILFLANLTNGAQIRSLRMFAFMAMYLNVTPYTAFVTVPSVLMLCGFCSAWVLRHCRLRWGRLTRCWAPVTALDRRPRLCLVAAAILVSLTSMGATRAVLREICRQADSVVAGSALTNSACRAIYVASGIASFLLVVLTVHRRRKGAGLLVRATLAAALTVGAAAVFCKLAHYHEPLTFAVARVRLPRALLLVELFLACGVAAWASLGGQPRALAATLRRLTPLVPFGLAVLVGYGAAFALFTGYVKTGYHDRWLSFVVPGTILLPATGLYLIAQLLKDRFRNWGWRQKADREPFLLRTRTNIDLLIQRGTFAALAVLALVFIGTWVKVQWLHFTFMSPDQFKFLGALDSFAGRSFITSSYASPVAWETRQWAYADPYFAAGNVQLSETGYLLQRDVRYGIWLADWNANGSYEHPEYLAVVNFQNLITEQARIADHLRGTRTDVAPLDVCGLRTRNIMQSEVVAADPSGLGRWGIVRLNWDFPPYLDRLDGVGSDRVRLRHHIDDTVSVDYRYRQQQGHPEDRTIVRLFLVDGEGRRTLLEENVRDRSFVVPTGLPGNLQASVTPCSNRKEGEEFFSNFIPVGVPSLAAPHLQLRRSEMGPCFVSARSAGGRIDLDYDYEHEHGEVEYQSVVRLYLQNSPGNLQLLTQTVGTRTILIPSVLPLISPGATLRVSVIPQSAQAAGREYLAPQSFPIAPSDGQGVQGLPAPAVSVTPHSDGKTLLLFVDAPCAGSDFTLALQALTKEGSFITVREVRNQGVLLMKPDEHKTVRVVVKRVNREGASEEVPTSVILNLSTEAKSGR